MIQGKCTTVVSVFDVASAIKDADTLRIMPVLLSAAITRSDERVITYAEKNVQIFTLGRSAVNIEPAICNGHLP